MIKKIMIMLGPNGEPTSVIVPFKFRSGIMKMDISDATGHQTFSHQDDKGTWRHWHIPTLQDLCEKGKAEKITLGVDRQHALFMVNNNGIEKDHVFRLPMERLKNPGIAVYFETDDTWVIVDGNHRYVRAFLEGWKEMPFYKVSEKTARYAQLELPDDLAKVVCR